MNRREVLKVGLGVVGAGLGVRQVIAKSSITYLYTQAMLETHYETAMKEHGKPPYAFEVSVPFYIKYQEHSGIMYKSNMGYWMYQARYKDIPVVPTILLNLPLGEYVVRIRDE